ncbi:hypothetical protein AVEN_38743-1 [Araneus ventricosus]|uniref:Uncharacterized protein n=1 Tax=Araneus ventricosus TaxID=182803 RepID=A0A4Y2KD68_ARAVE|nr:hypothetical protein AVEN_38743-1 [Araneus ventricosus]
MDKRYYHSASNSLLARTTDRTPKTFALQGDIISIAAVIQALSHGKPWCHMESSSTFKCISSANGDIEKIPAPLRSHISLSKSPRWSPSLTPISGPTKFDNSKFDTNPSSSSGSTLLPLGI